MGGRRVKKITGEKAKEPVKRKPEKPRPKVEGPRREPGKAIPKKLAKRVKKKKVRGKRYQEAKKKLEEGKLCPLPEAIKLVKESSYANFDASVEAHINLGLEVDKAEHQIRMSVSLLHGTGKKIKVLVFAEGKEAQAALDAGADGIGDEKTIEEIAKSGKVGFDSIVSTPEFMPKLAKIARILGPQGLMPTPKSGTVADKPADIVSELKRGRVELRTEKQPIIHTVIGKVSFPEKKLIENLKAIVEELNRVRPTKVKGEYIKSVYLKPTMGPAVKISLESLDLRA